MIKFGLWAIRYGFGRMEEKVIVRFLFWIVFIYDIL
jgi:hypothetical protein